MKRYVFRFSVSLLAFFVGTASVWVHSRLRMVPPTPAGTSLDPAAQIVAPLDAWNAGGLAGSPSARAAGRLTKGLRVTFLRLKPSQDGIRIVYRTGEFRVDNEGKEAAYYVGYGKNSYLGAGFVRGGKFRSGFKQGGEFKDVSYICGTGLEEQSLLPGESAIFAVEIPDGKGPFEAGFNFLLGRRRFLVTARSLKLARPLPSDA